MKTICVFCGSALGVNSAFIAAATELGRYLASNKINLVYGGSNCGLMGIVAGSVLKNGGKVIAVMPEDILKKCGHTNGAKLIIVENMQQRKQKMFDLSDGFIVLPEGYGTLDEIFEMLTWRQLGYHKKPCGFLNIDGFFDLLFSFLDTASAHCFVSSEHRSLAFSANNIPDLMKHFIKS